jgi:glycosyltransferase involved in cell wall biosynthesis
MDLTLRMLFTDPCSDMGIARTAMSICRHLNGPGLSASMHVPTAAYGVRAPFLRPSLPYIRPPVPWEPHFRFIAGWARARMYRHFLHSLNGGNIAYLWSNVAMSCVDELVERNIPIIREKFNCHTATAQRILDEAYAGLGVTRAPARIPGRVIEDERRILAHADLVSSPSPGVTESLIQEGVPAERIVETSYGWDPGIPRTHPPALPATNGVTVLFVGAVCVRKGAHLLLDCWSRAQIRGRLVLCGPVEPVIADLYRDELRRHDVLTPGRVRDVWSFYRSADLLALPTLEEGSPLVCYEALASGLPAIVSPMGAGSVVRDGQEGFVLNCPDCDAWTDALRRLSNDEELRRHMSDAARQRATEFTWQRTGARRRVAFLKRLRPGAGAAPATAAHSIRAGSLRTVCIAD